MNPRKLTPDQFQAAVNTSSVIDAVLSTGSTIQPYRFGEVALDLTALDIITDTCEGFGAATVKSRSSSESFEASLEDFIAPVPIVVGNCKLEVKKATIPTTDSGKFNLLVNGLVKASNVGNTGTTGVVPVTTSAEIPVSETAAPQTGTSLANYTTELACVNRKDGSIFTVSDESLGGDRREGFVTLKNNDDVVCTFTNSRIPSLTLDKIVVNDNGGTRAESEWTLTANGGAAGTLSGPGAAGDTDVVSDGTFKAGTYVLSESGPTDYSNGGFSCSKNGGEFAAATSITLGLGDTGVCKITNNDRAPGLTLDKIVVNDNGGTRAESEWTLTANGGAAGTLSGPGAAGDTDVVSDGTFKPGTYVLSESGPTDYSNGGFSCSKNGGEFAAATSITLGLGDTGVCKITNNDRAPGLTLDKIVVNDNGGTRARV